MMTSIKHVVVTQPYVPAYRIPLFDAVQRHLAERGATFEVYADSARGDQAARGDQVDADWLRRLNTRTIRIGNRGIDFRSGPPGLASADVIVTELAVGNTLGWRRLLTRKPTILWGHGAPYTTKPSRLGDFLKVCMIRLAKHTMTYTEGGVTYLVAKGAPADKLTAIGNSTDTETLRRSVIELRDPAREIIAPTALFIGGLDASKRIDFILEAAEHAARRDPAFRLLIVGRGPLDGVVAAAVNRLKMIRVIPEARGRELAELAASADMIWMPGRVGLVAVDAIALGLPVHTVRHEAHAPELELLHGDEVEYLPDNPSDFARISVQRAGQLPLRADYPTVDRVANKMVGVVLRIASNRESARKD